MISYSKKNDRVYYRKNLNIYCNQLIECICMYMGLNTLKYIKLMIYKLVLNYLNIIQSIWCKKNDIDLCKKLLEIS